MMPAPRVNVWPPLPLMLYTCRPSKWLPFPLEEPDCASSPWPATDCSWASSPLSRAGNEILVPAYHHGSELEALVRAGIVCRFYDVGQRLEPDEKEQEALRDTPVQALFLIHHLGLPQHAVRWCACCDEHGLLLIEDAAQAIPLCFSDPVGPKGGAAPPAGRAW
jgi:hypothetical protein